MVLVPAIHGGDSRVFLWSRNNVSSPRHIFTGHSESVVEVQWRRQKGGVCMCGVWRPGGVSEGMGVAVCALVVGLQRKNGGGGSGGCMYRV